MYEKATGLSIVTPPTASTMSRKPSKSIDSQCSISRPVTSERTDAMRSAAALEPALGNARCEDVVDLPVLRELGHPLEPEVARDRDRGRRVGRRVDGEDLDRVREVRAVVVRAAVADEQHVDPLVAVEAPEEGTRREAGGRDGVVERRCPHPQQHSPGTRGDDEEEEHQGDRPPDRASPATSSGGRPGAGALRGSRCRIARSRGVCPRRRRLSGRHSARADQLAVVGHVVVSVSVHTGLMLRHGRAGRALHRIEPAPISRR